MIYHNGVRGFANYVAYSVDQSATEDHRNRLSKAEAARQVTENEIQAIRESEKDYNARLSEHNKLKVFFIVFRSHSLLTHVILEGTGRQRAGNQECRESPSHRIH